MSSSDDESDSDFVPEDPSEDEGKKRSVGRQKTRKTRRGRTSHVISSDSEDDEPSVSTRGKTSDVNAKTVPNRKSRVDDIWQKLKSDKPVFEKPVERKRERFVEKEYDFAGKKVLVKEKEENVEKGALEALVDSRKKKARKLSAFEKSRLDWEKYKSIEGEYIVHEMEQFKKNGFVEKQEFLHRAQEAEYDSRKQ